jgi:hypothetical protein
MFGYDIYLGCLSFIVEVLALRFCAATLGFFRGAGKISPLGEVVFPWEVVAPLFLYKSKRVRPSSESLSSSSVTGSVSGQEEMFR